MLSIISHTVLISEDPTLYLLVSCRDIRHKRASLFLVQIYLSIGQLIGQLSVVNTEWLINRSRMSREIHVQFCDLLLPISL